MLGKALDLLRAFARRFFPGWRPTRGRGVGRIVGFLVAWLRPELLPTRHGFALRIPRGDGSAIVQSLLIDREYEPEETARILQLLRPGDVAIDVGAHLGYMSCLMARAVGEMGQVHAFEPHERQHALLLENLERNGYRQVAARRVALSASARRRRLYLCASNPGDHTLVELAGRRSVEVPSQTFDDYWQERLGSGGIRLIKIDVQGHEVEVLGGMERVLASGLVDYLLIEVWPYRLRLAGTSWGELFDRIDEGSWCRHVVSVAGDVVVADLDEVRAYCDRSPRDERFSFNLLAARRPA